MLPARFSAVCGDAPPQSLSIFSRDYDKQGVSSLD
jgi:hypothetical protein